VVYLRRLRCSGQYCDGKNCDGVSDFKVDNTSYVVINPNDVTRQI